MNILAIETSAGACSIAVACGETIRSYVHSPEKQQHTESILTLIERGLAQAGIGPGDLDVFAVATGPGLFTGLRVGISTAQGLAFALGRQLIGVSSLEIIARQAGAAALICPMMDARRGQVYTCLYRTTRAGTLVRVEPDTVIDPAVWAGRLSGTVLFTGSGAIRYHELITGACPGTVMVAPAVEGIPRASTLALIAAEGRRTGRIAPPEHVTPRYVRPPDAKEPALQ